MDKRKLLKYSLLLIIAIVIGISLFILGNRYALNHLSIRYITPTQAANAMKDDHFWSSYRENTLIITGDVISVAKSGDTTIIGFKTDSSYGAECSFTNIDNTITNGQTIKVLTIANNAQREPLAVKLNNCVLQ